MAETTPSTAAASIEKALGLRFNDRDLLQRAFVHRSYLNERGDVEVSGDNERLEFLGDSVLNFVTSEQLFWLYPNYQEGDLTRLRATLVRRETLAAVALRLGLGDLLLLGRGEEESGGRTRPAILCATFEALVGAIFCDQGIEAARRYALEVLSRELAATETFAVAKDPKSRLQEYAQSVYGHTPRYRTSEISGPDHARFFVQVVMIARHAIGVGKGLSKQGADQMAAAMALYRLGQPAPEYLPDEALEAGYPLASPSLLEDVSAEPFKRSNG